MLTGIRNVLHLRITQSTTLRVVINISKDKLAWYNESQIHDTVLHLLHPVIVHHLTDVQGSSTTKRKKDTEAVLNARDKLCDKLFQLSYCFTKIADNQQCMLLRVGDAGVCRYKPLSVYPDQLLVYVDESQAAASHSLETYWA